MQSRPRNTRCCAGSRDAEEDAQKKDEDDKSHQTCQSRCFLFLKTKQVTKVVLWQGFLCWQQDFVQKPGLETKQRHEDSSFMRKRNSSMHTLIKYVSNMYVIEVNLSRLLELHEFYASSNTIVNFQLKYLRGKPATAKRKHQYRVKKNKQLSFSKGTQATSFWCLMNR